MSLLDQFMNRMTQVKDKVKETFTPNNKNNQALEDYARKMLELSQQGLLNAGGNKGMEMIFEQIAGEARKVLGEEAPKHLTPPEAPQSEDAAMNQTIEVNTRSEGFQNVDAEEAEYEEVIEETAKTQTDDKQHSESEQLASEDENIANETDATDVIAANDLKQENESPEETTEMPKASAELEEKTEASSEVESVAPKADEGSAEAEKVETPLQAETDTVADAKKSMTAKESDLLSKTDWINTIVAEAQEKTENIEAIADAIALAVREAIAGKKKVETPSDEQDEGNSDQNPKDESERPQTEDDTAEPQPIEVIEKAASAVEPEPEATAENSPQIEKTEQTEAEGTKDQDLEAALVEAEAPKAAQEITEKAQPESEKPMDAPQPEREDDAEKAVIPEAETEKVSEPEPEPAVVIDPTAFVGKKIIYGAAQKGGNEGIVQCFKDWQIEYVEVNNGLKTVESFSACEPGTYDGLILEKNLFLMDAVTATKCIRKLKHPDAAVPIGVVSFNSSVNETLFKGAGINAWTTDNQPEDLYLMMQAMWKGQDE